MAARVTMGVKAGEEEVRRGIGRLYMKNKLMFVVTLFLRKASTMKLFNIETRNSSWSL